MSGTALNSEASRRAQATGVRVEALAAGLDAADAYRAAVDTFLAGRPIATWEVRDYTTMSVLHTADCYEQADDWRLLNHPDAVVIPHWRQP